VTVIDHRIEDAVQVSMDRHMYYLVVVSIVWYRGKAVLTWIVGHDEHGLWSKTSRNERA